MHTTQWVDWTGRPVTRKPDRLAASVTAAIFDDARRLLLMRRADNGFWGLPGGNIEIGESVTAATAREVREETGLIVRVGRLIGVYSDPLNHMIASYPNGALVHYVGLCFECTPVGGVLQGSVEGMEVAYFAPDALPGDVLLPHRLRIADALAARAEAFVR